MVTPISKAEVRELIGSTMTGEAVWESRPLPSYNSWVWGRWRLTEGTYKWHLSRRCHQGPGGRSRVSARWRFGWGAHIFALVDAVAAQMAQAER